MFDDESGRDYGLRDDARDGWWMRKGMFLVVCCRQFDRPLQVLLAVIVGRCPRGGVDPAELPFQSQTTRARGQI
jgi:hypothetical protein